ncbi:MAG: hypothetical protein PGN09_08225 [Sphingomonas fennica]
MSLARTAATAAFAFGAMLAAAPVRAETTPVPATQTAALPAATGEVRDIVQTAFFQALTTPAATAPAPR